MQCNDSIFDSLEYYFQFHLVKKNIMEYDLKNKNLSDLLLQPPPPKKK